ncbi:MAG: hypothetical protein AMXMBFR82_34900 [Candidatus Hydrogenedentota bacterium]
MAIHSEILDLVNATPFVDTHEHLWEERTRLSALAEPGQHPMPSDLGILFYHYADSDLVSAGLSAEDRKKMVDPMTDVHEKWRLIGPIYARTRHTGYLQNVRESLRLMFGEDDITDDNYARISDLIRGQIAPGYFKRLLRDVSKIEHTQVNSFEDPVFNETEYPDLLCQDLSFVGMSSGLNIEPYAKKANREVGSLQDWHEIIDWVFETYGPRAIAIKNQSAYARRLDYDDVPANDAAPLFARHIRDAKGSAEFEKKAIQDHLFHYCIRKAVDYNLPVKLHTGYYAGNNHMPLHRVGANVGDLCPIIKAHPDAKFIIMHISYPYQDEAIALAKHYPNAYVDMCWAWIINPLASVRFTKEFLMAAPHTKLLTFGGDYGPVEMVPGHAAIARKGLAQAVSELISDGWVNDGEVPALVDRIMRGNAHEIFDYEGTLAAWNSPAA